MTPAGLVRLEAVRTWIIAEMPLSEVSSFITGAGEKPSESGDCPIERRGHTCGCATLGDISHNAYPVRVSTGQKRGSRGGTLRRCAIRAIELHPFTGELVH